MKAHLKTLLVLIVIATVAGSVPAAATEAPAAAGQLAALTDPSTTGLPSAGRDATAPTNGTPAPTPSQTYFSALELDHIRAAVRGHVLALAAGNANGAFASLAPSTKDFYGSPEVFMAALSAAVGPLATAGAFALAETGRDSIDAIQSVVITGRDGARWLARFTVERQPDGGWGIKRCSVEASTDSPEA